MTRRLDQAFGAEPEPLSPISEVPVRRVRLSFAEPIADPTDLARAIEHLVAELAKHLEHEGNGARRLDLAFHRVDGRVEHIRVGTARPSRDARHLAGLLAAKLETVDPGLGIEDTILALIAAEPLAPRQMQVISLPRRGKAVADDVAPLLDRLGARLGLDAIGRIATRASHIPERTSFFAPIGGGVRPDPLPQVGEGALSKPPRPIRLFMPPEPVEATWVLPDEPPFRFIWRRRAHRVCRAKGPERISEEWWSPAGAAAAVSIGAIRDYLGINLLKTAPKAFRISSGNN